ncbi:MAG: hypothetical protein M3R49_08610 [Chloroflexota bacterium]|nr:hypothetical protein [Chloroflexota bacterium]
MASPFYIHPDDPEGHVEAHEQLGGRLLLPLSEVASQTTIALFADPEGHVA